MEEIFTTEFIDGEFRAYDANGRMVVRQPYFPDGTKDPWTEEDALDWWEQNKKYYSQYRRIQE